MMAPGLFISLKYHIISHLFLMESLVDHKTHYDQLVSYFATYLRDINAVISEVKGLAYTLINIPQPNIKASPINNDIASVMSACKRTFDDIKRTESILRGHVKGKQSPASSRVAMSSSKAQSITPVKAPELQNDQELPQKLNNSRSPRMNLELSSNLSKQRSKFVLNELEKDEQRSTCINQQNPPSARKERDERHSRHASEQLHESPKEIEDKIENLRLSRSKDLQVLASENDECISLIHKIRNQLKIRKK